MGNIPNVKVTRQNGRTFNRVNNYNRGYRTNVQPVPSAREQVPAPYANLVSILKYNADMKRLVSLGIIKDLKETGVVEKDAKCYIKYLWNKFSVKSNGRIIEYPYGDEVFIKNMSGAVRAMAALNMNILAFFVQYDLKKNLNEIISDEESVNKSGEIINLAVNSDDDNEEDEQGE